MSLMAVTVSFINLVLVRQTLASNAEELKRHAGAQTPPVSLRFAATAVFKQSDKRHTALVCFSVVLQVVKAAFSHRYNDFTASFTGRNIEFLTFLHICCHLPVNILHRSDLLSLGDITTA